MYFVLHLTLWTFFLGEKRKGTFRLYDDKGKKNHIMACGGYFCIFSLPFVPLECFERVHHTQTCTDSCTMWTILSFSFNHERIESGSFLFSTFSLSISFEDFLLSLDFCSFFQKVDGNFLISQREWGYLFLPSYSWFESLIEKGKWGSIKWVTHTHTIHSTMKEEVPFIASILITTTRYDCDDIRYIYYMCVLYSFNISASSKCVSANVIPSGCERILLHPIREFPTKTLDVSDVENVIDGVLLWGFSCPLILPVTVIGYNGQTGNEVNNVRTWEGLGNPPVKQVKVKVAVVVDMWVRETPVINY